MVKPTLTASGLWLRTGEIAGLPLRVREEGAFLPRPLPGELPVSLRTQNLLSRAHHLAGRLDEAAVRLTDRRILVRTTQLREAQSMLALKQVIVAFREVLAAELSGRVPSPPEVLAVRQFLRASDEAARRVHDSPVGETVFRLAAAVADPLRAEQTVHNRLPWRSGPRWFGGGRAEHAYLLAAPPGADLRGAAEQWKVWVDTTTDMQVVAKLALGAYQLYTLAPLEHADELVYSYVSLELIKAGLVEDQCVPVSVFVDRNRARFERLHRQVVDTGDFDDWVGFFAEAIIEQCESQLMLVHALERERHRHFERLPTRNDAIARVVNALSGNPMLTAQLVARLCQISVKQSRTLIQKLEGYGLLKEVGSRKRNKLYEVPTVMRLLNLYDGRVSPQDRSLPDPARR
ncbi:Fic family protein [Actinophytocola xanthii]|uniref:Fido domain-containing protein n=1 Tax=Actinophytocola xanthii TaxID=1912961 RepID=A0A1Q8CNP3_9PSEU|nr:hypothetical protein [Actinophytocola xanthii]OLF15970.1 hypothetical protein BU204_18885 [Actinophytocola xanthii]